MSMMRCDFCDEYVDTDYDVEGEYAEKANRFMCANCCQDNEIESAKALDEFISEGVVE